MRKTRPLDALFPRIRQALLAATLLHPEQWWYLSDLAKHLGVRPSSLQRELAALVEAGILSRRQDGNRVYFQPNPACPFLPELQGLLVKTAGVVDVLRDVLSRFATRIDWTFVYGSIARAEELVASDVDLMVVGHVGLADLTPALRRAEERLGRPVNPILYSREEFATKLRAGHHFLQAVLDGEKLFILGNPHELAAATRSPPGAAHTTSRHELDGLRAIAERDLNDANVQGLSADRQFATAYNAVLQLAKMAIACAGYRVVGQGHHLTTFEAVELAMGRSIAPLARYFETCRRKRNMLDYDMANVATETEVRELLEKAEEFRQLVEQWMAQHHPQFTA
jgi:uncharacterized protein